MAKRFAATIRQEHQQTFLAYNEIPRWPPCPTHQLFRLDLQRKRVSTSGEGAADTEDSDQEREFLPYSHVFSRIQIGEKPVRILVEGGPGIGKTALCMLLFKGWENGVFFQKFELLLLLPLHQAKIAKARSLPELICVLFPSHSHEITSYIIQTRGEKVLIIADGLNKLAETFQKGSFLHNLLLGGLLSQASVLITSRPSTSAPLHKLSCVDDFLEVYGFDCSTIHQYIRAKFDNDQQKAISLLEQLESNPIIEQICKIPLNCAVVCFLWKNNTDVFSTTTGLFTEVILNFVYRNMLNTDEYSSHPRLLNIHSLPESLRSPWRSVCEIAFQIIRFNLGANPQVNLEAIRLSQSGFEILGMLEFVELDKISFLFLHPTFQEYFAALYLIMQPLDRQMVIFKLHSKSKHLTLFFRFFFGLCFQISGSVHVDMAATAQIMRVLSESYIASNDEYLLCHYAFEAKNTTVTEGIISALSDRTKSFVSMSFGHPSTAQDCVTVMYIIANIQEHTFVEIDFHDCHLGDKRICELATVLSNKAKIVQVKILNLSNNNLTDVCMVNLFNWASAAFQCLMKLFLRDNTIGATSICAIKTALAKSSHSMKVLDLSNNPLLMDGIKELQIAIEYNSLLNLEILFLRDALPMNSTSNNITCLNVFAIAVSSHCPRLRRLDLSAIDLGEPGDSAICKLVSQLSGNRTRFDLTLNREYMGEVDKRFIAIMEDSMKNKGTIDHTVVHGIIVGPGRSGKDSLMNRLLGKDPQDKNYPSASTGVLESVVKVEVKKLCCTTVAAAVSNLIWRRLDYNEEALELMMTTAKCCSITHESKLRKFSQSKVNPNTNSAHDEIRDQNTECDMPGRSVSSDNLRIKPKTHYFDEYLCDDEFEKGMLQNQASQLLIVPVEDKWPGVTDILKSAVKSQRMDDLREHLESSWSLYLTNTGGQMEFQELLPLLVCGPSAFFVTFPLNKNLMEHYTVQYHHNDADRTEETYTSPSTLMDELLQTLATIDALNLTGHQQDFQLMPKVFLIGTHKDKLPKLSVDERIKEIDQQIQEKIRQTSLFHQGSIVFAEGTKQLTFTVNNLAKDDTDFQKIRCALQQTIEKTDQFTIKCPSTWLIFSLVLRAKHKSSQVLTFDECFTIAQGCGISDRTELSNALHFIHTRLGLVRYFNIKELNKRVVIDPQILFDKITHLIVKTFTCDNAEVNEVEDFQSRGIFSIKTMERICRKRHNSDSPLPVLPFKWLLKLLSYLRIIAVFKDKKGDLKCFFPAVLCHAPDQLPTSLKNPDLAQHPSLLVAFEGGFCPRGIPGALITYLMTTEMDSGFSWELIPYRVFKNQVCFSIEGCSDIILKIHPTYLQLYLDPEAEISDNNELQMTLGEVYKCIKQGMTTITKGYKNCDYFFAYHCTLHDCKKHLHPAKIIWRNDRPVKLKCKITGKQYNLPSDHSIWDLQRVNYKELPVPRQKLDLPLDYYNHGVSQHLGQIANSMREWEGPIAEALRLTPAIVANIKTKHPTDLNLQTRLALEMWKQSQGCGATYGKLIAAFEIAGCQAYADVVRRLANDIDIPANYFGDDDCHESPPVTPETCIQSLFLTNMPDDNHNKLEDVIHITEKGASELKKIDEKLDIPLSYEPDANTASVVMKHGVKEQSRFQENNESEAAASTGPETAPNTSTEADTPTSSNSTQCLGGNTLSTGRPGNPNQNESCVTNPLMNLSQDVASLASTALPYSPISSVPNPESDATVGNKQSTVLSRLEPAITPQQPVQQQQQQQQQPEPQSLPLSTPNLLTTISSSILTSTQSSSPTQFGVRDQVTAEQEMYAQGFIDELRALHQEEQTQNRLKGCPWYLGKKSRIDAELALHRMKDGVFLIYESDMGLGDYAIVIKWKKMPMYIKILKHPVTHKFCISDECEFFSIEELVGYYQQNSLGSSFPGVNTTLRYPYHDTAEAGEEKQHSIPVALDFPTWPGASHPQQISQQQQQQQQLQEQQMGGASEQISGASQLMSQQQQTVQGIQQPQQQARPMVVWSGIMEIPEVDNKHQMRQVQCNVLTSKSDVIRELQPSQWPQRMNMNTYPKVLFNLITQMMNFRSGANVKAVIFQFLENPQNITRLGMLQELSKPESVSLKYFALVQLVGVQQLSQCPIKALILVWNDRHKYFTGIVPLEQEKFINILKQVLSDAQQQKAMLQQEQQQQQQQAQQAQQGQQTGRMEAMKMTQIQQFLRAIAFSSPWQQEQLLQRVPMHKRAQVLMRAQQLRQQVQQQQQQNVGRMRIGQSQDGMGMGQNQPGMNALPGQQQQHQMGDAGNMTSASSSVGSMQQRGSGGGVTVTAFGGQEDQLQIQNKLDQTGSHHGEKGGVSQGGQQTQRQANLDAAMKFAKMAKQEAEMAKQQAEMRKSGQGVQPRNGPIRLQQPCSYQEDQLQTQNKLDQTGSHDGEKDGVSQGGQQTQRQTNLDAARKFAEMAKQRAEIRKSGQGVQPRSGPIRLQQPGSHQVDQLQIQNKLDQTGSHDGEKGGVSQGGQQTQRQTNLNAARKFAEMAKQQAEIRKSGQGVQPRSGPIRLQQPGSHQVDQLQIQNKLDQTGSHDGEKGGVSQGGQQTQRQTNLNAARKFAEMAKQQAEILKSGQGVQPRSGPIRLQQPGSHPVMVGMTTTMAMQQQQQQQQQNVGGMEIGQHQGGMRMGQNPHGMNIIPNQQQIPAGVSGVQYPPPGTGPVIGDIPPPAHMMMNPWEITSGQRGTRTAIQNNSLLLRRLQEEQQRRAMLQQQLESLRQNAMPTATGYPAGQQLLVQGPQYAMRPVSIQTNPSIPVGPIMQSPQQPQYVQQIAGIGFNAQPFLSSDTGSMMTTGSTSYPSADSVSPSSYLSPYATGTQYTWPTPPAQSSQPGMNMTRQIPAAVSGVIQQQQQPPGMGGMQMQGVMNVPRPGTAPQQQMPPGSGGYWQTQ